jgi:hypothetical protein
MEFGGNPNQIFCQKVVYKLRDLGYYGDFNAADIAELC